MAVGGFNRLTGCVLGVALAFVMLAVAVAAPAATPRAFVEAIYKSYLGKDSKGVLLTDEAAIRRYFAPPLADALVKDRAEADKRGDVPTLDGDPFVDAQDWEISRLSINVNDRRCGHRHRDRHLHQFQEARDHAARPREDGGGLAHRRDQGAKLVPAGFDEGEVGLDGGPDRRTKASLIPAIRRRLKHHR